MEVWGVVVWGVEVWGVEVWGVVVWGCCRRLKIVCFFKVVPTRSPAHPFPLSPAPTLNGCAVITYLRHVSFCFTLWLLGAGFAAGGGHQGQQGASPALRGAPQAAALHGSAAAGPGLPLLRGSHVLPVRQLDQRSGANQQPFWNNSQRKKWGAKGGRSRSG